MKPSRVPVNGSVFLVPLPRTGFGIGLLVRADGKGRAYGEFFGPRVKDASEVDIAQLRSEDAVLRCRFGDHGLYKKNWVLIGTIPKWSELQCPLPKFHRRHDDPTKCYVTEYGDNLDLISETISSVDQCQGLPEDVQLGSGVVEIKLDGLLA